MRHGTGRAGRAAGPRSRRLLPPDWRDPGGHARVFQSECVEMEPRRGRRRGAARTHAHELEGARVSRSCRTPTEHLPRQPFHLPLDLGPVWNGGFSSTLGQAGPSPGRAPRRASSGTPQFQAVRNVEISLAAVAGETSGSGGRRASGGGRVRASAGRSPCRGSDQVIQVDLRRVERLRPPGPPRGPSGRRPELAQRRLLRNLLRFAGAGGCPSCLTKAATPMPRAASAPRVRAARRSRRPGRLRLGLGLGDPADENVKRRSCQ